MYAAQSIHTLPPLILQSLEHPPHSCRTAASLINITVGDAQSCLLTTLVAGKVQLLSKEVKQRLNYLQAIQETQGLSQHTMAATHTRADVGFALNRFRHRQHPQKATSFCALVHFSAEPLYAFLE